MPCKRGRRPGKFSSGTMSGSSWPNWIRMLATYIIAWTSTRRPWSFMTEHSTCSPKPGTHQRLPWWSATGPTPFRKGNYNEALKLLHDLKPVLAELGDPVTATLCDLDTLESYLELSLFEDAVELAGHVRAGFTKLKMGYELAKALAYGAVAKLQLGNYSRAETELKEAKAIFETEGNQTYSALMNVYLAEEHVQRRTYEEAIPPCREALEIFLSNKLPIKANYARLQLAKAKRRQGDTRAAGKLCVEALKAFDEYEPPWLAYQLYHLLGGIRREEKDDAQAHACYLKAIVAIERMRSHVQSDEFKSTV